MNESNHAPLEMSQQFADLVFLALDHGINSVKSGGPLVPFTVYEVNGKRELHRYAAKTVEESVRQARLAALALPTTVSMCAIAYDGLVTLQGKEYDAIIVEASEQDKAFGVKLAQRYTPKKLFKSFQVIENPLSLGECKPILKPA